MIKIYNTLSRKKETFKPVKEGHVGMYTCGPTVYWYQHIGNLRAYLFADTLKRVLKYNGYDVTQIINITDVGHLSSDADEGEDKMEKAAIKEGRSAKDIAKHYFDVFHSDLEKLHIIEPSKWVKATEHIPEQINLVKRLQEKGYTYQTTDGIYFDSSKFKDYGKLAKLKIEGLEAGKRISLGEKRNKTDFALWKLSSKPGLRQQEWQSPWGIGFPGWHIECSAMSMKYLGERIDIHTGGIDHIPIHHTNEIAQSEAATGKKFVNYWLHNEFLTFKGEKVSKSKGGLFTLSELEGLGYHPLHYRYLFLQTHYRKPLNFTLDNLDSSKNAYERIKRKVIELKKEEHKGVDKTKEYGSEFLDAVNDDLNTPKALQVFLKALEDFDFDPKKRYDLLLKFDEVLALDIRGMKEESLAIPDDVLSFMDEREKMRKEKKWAEADILRQRIKDRGYSIVDTPKGPTLKKD